MRGSLTAVAILGVCLLNSNTLQAGLYNTAEPVKGPRATPGGVKPLGFTQFRDVLTDVSNISNPLKESALRKHYLEQRDKLLAKSGAQGLRVEEKVNLSEYLIRLGDFEKAVELLTPLATREQRNFMVFTNLGTAQQLAGRLERAVGYLEQVKDTWPQEWPGWSKEQLDWYRQAEKYHLRLVRLRYRESRQQAGRGKPPATLDDLFGGDKGAMRFVAEGGQYEAGKLAASEKEKLPINAEAIVEQLLIWIPGPPGMADLRLHWLLGELYNSAGDIPGASGVFQTLVWTSFNAPDLREHRRIVQAAMPEQVTVKQAEPQPVAEKTSWMPNMQKMVLVGALAALVIAGLIYMQVREFRRRRKSLQ